jgi:uncharacterized protein (TIGR03435 family)
MLWQYASEVGVPGIAPHDLRRTCAKLCRAAGGELERYPGTKQDEAIEKQLGIKLEQTKRPATVMIIDHLERKPDEN